MMHPSAQSPADHRLVVDLLETLSSSLDVKSVFNAAFPILAKLVPTDFGALCVSSPEAQGGYDWFCVDFPVDWFCKYQEMAPHDFVRQSVMRAPNTVMCDFEMLPRKELESNMMYRRSREIGVPLEQVMSVMLDFGAGWHAGVTLYRARQHSFSDQDRLALQQLIQPLWNAARNCKLFSNAQRRGSLIESVIRHKELEAAFISPRLTEIARTDGLEPRIRRWFASAELNCAGFPNELLTQLGTLMRRKQIGKNAPSTWSRNGTDASLHVTFVPIPEATGTPGWAIVFQEVSPMPKLWKEHLTPAQCRIVKYILTGWDTRLIAEELRIERTTVKKHVQNIFNRLGVSSRLALCNLASKQR
jgi:DNA-binding CsgD family transcriptional regulator